MTMKIAINKQVSFFFHSFDQLLTMVNGGVIFSGRIDPLTVQINHCEIAPIVADNDSVNVEHGDNFKDEVLPQNFGHA
jgi:hypothetical protein